VLCLNHKNRLLCRHLCVTGTATGVLVHPARNLRAPILSGATSIICVHNHPSGDPAPSSADLQMTRKLRKAARIMAINLIGPHYHRRP